LQTMMRSSCSGMVRRDGSAGQSVRRATVRTPAGLRSGWFRSAGC
jgi:hypothetical protein